MGERTVVQQANAANAAASAYARALLAVQPGQLRALKRAPFVTLYVCRH